MKYRFKHTRRQQGSFLLEVTFALIISSIASLAAFKMNMETSRLNFASIQGDTMNTISAAAQSYTREFFAQLQSNSNVTKTIGASTTTLLAGTNDGQTFAPTVANLVAMGYLPATISAQSSFSNDGRTGTYRIHIERKPAGCQAVFTSCDVTGYVYVDQPVLAAGSAEPDGPGIAAIVSRLGGYGGFTMNATPAQLIFLDGEVIANPVPGNPAGIVATKFGYGSSGLGQFLRVRDTRDPDLQGNLTAAGDLKVAGKSAVAGISTASSYATDVKTIGAGCPDANAIGSAAGTVVVCNGGVWQALVTLAAPSSGCGPDGKVATSTSTGEQLTCKNGFFIPSNSLIAKNVLVNRVAVRDGDVVGKPNCAAGGVPDRSFSLTQISTDETTAPPKQSMYSGTIDNGPSWTIVIRMRDDTGGEVSANSHNVTAVLNLECKY